MNRPTVTGSQRIAVAVTVIVGGLVTVLLPLTFPRDGGPTGFDTAVGDWIHRALDAHPGVYDGLVIPSNGYIVIPLLLAGVVWYAWRRQWWSAGFLLVAPELTVAINTWVLKPLWHRHLDHYLAYPSGHTVQFVSIATAFVLVAGTSTIRAIEIAAAVVVLVVIAVGMIGHDYHYPTDIVAGTATAITLVTAMSVTLGAIRRGRKPESPR